MYIVTPLGRVRARAKIDNSLDPGVVCAQHGWWQACDELGLPAIDAFGDDSVNLNLIVPHEPSDPVGGSVLHRSYICNVVRIDGNSSSPLE